MQPILQYEAIKNVADASVSDQTLLDAIDVFAEIKISNDGKMLVPWANVPMAFIAIDDCISKKRFERLKKQKIYVFRSHAPLAFAWKGYVRPIIFVSDELLSLLTFQSFHCMCMKEFSDNEIARSPSAVGFSLLDELESLYYNAIRLRFNGATNAYYHHDEILNSHLDLRTFLGFRESAILFILLHEMGHVELGHFNDIKGTKGLSPPSLFIDEAFSKSLSWEYAADAYAFDSLTAKGIGSGWGAIFQDFAILEAYHGLPFGETHPRSINRLHSLLEQIKARNDPSDAVVIEAWMSSLLDAGRFYEGFIKLQEQYDKYPGSDLKYESAKVLKTVVQTEDGLNYAVREYSRILFSITGGSAAQVDHLLTKSSTG